MDTDWVLCVRQKVQRTGVVQRALLLNLLIVSILAFVLGVPAGTLAENAGKFTPKFGTVTFMSANRKVSCVIYSQYRLRATCSGLNKSFHENPPQYSGQMARSGRVRICRVAHPFLGRACFQQFIPHPTLPYGQHIEYAGVRCTSARNGITCIKLTKPRRGLGFRVSKDEAVRVKRNLGPGRLTIPTTAHNAFFKPSCDLSTRCSAQVTVKGGGKVLARGGYSIPAHSSRRVAIPLTAAGRKALAGKSRVGAKLTIVDTHTGKRETVPVVLKR